jgi:hypothetical protein
MSASAGALPRQSSTRAASQRSERLFFGSMCFVLALVVFAGFAPTYYLRGAFAGPALTGALYVHGFAFTSWMILLNVQAGLISTNRVALHRRLGVAGAALGAVMMVLGAYVAITRMRDGLFTTPPQLPGVAFLAIPLMTIVVFPALLGSALWLRRRTDYHKRLVLLATLELVTAAVARLPVISEGGPPAFFGVTDLFVVALALYDWKTRGRVHPATLWGGAFLIASQPLRIVIGLSGWWHTFGTWLTS